jgi:hypothetical protein
MSGNWRSIADAIIKQEVCDVQDVKSELDQTLSAYKSAVEEWIAAIREEEALASVNHSVVEFDQWEAAHFKEDKIRNCPSSDNLRQMAA